MRMIVSGASGFVGRQLVPLLKREGVELLLIGREPQKLAALFPGVVAGGYDDIQRLGSGFDLFLHLAVMNNDKTGSEADFSAVNVDLALKAAEAARAAGIPRFVYVSSVHALDPGNGSAYASSKRAAAEKLKKLGGIAVSTLYFPAVYGEKWAGNLTFLNRLPAWLSGLVFPVLQALKPTLSVSKLASFLITQKAWPEEIVLSDGQGDNLVYRAIIRLIDVLAAFAIFGLFFWLLAGIWLFTRLGSPGPGVFAQRRVGHWQKPFTLYKFRTMQAGTPDTPTHEAKPASVTPLGARLRRWKMDELPQAWNILMNEIALVGPRPCLPSQTELIEARERRGVYALKPGITGLAQVNGVDMSDPQKLARWDARYLALQSLSTDLRILLATVGSSARQDRIVADK